MHRPKALNLLGARPVSNDILNTLPHLGQMHICIYITFVICRDCVREAIKRENINMDEVGYFLIENYEK